MVKKAERSWDKVQEENTIIFGDTQVPLQQSVGQANDSHCVENQLDPCNHFATMLVHDRQT